MIASASLSYFVPRALGYLQLHTNLEIFNGGLSDNAVYS